MKKIFLFSSLCIFLIFNSCSKQNAPAAISGDVKEILSNGKSFEDIFKKTGTITLKPDTAHLIGDISGMIKLVNGQIVIADNLGSQLLLFDSKGYLIKQIGRKGKGPGEYLNLDDIVQKKNGNILVLSDNLRRVLEYQPNATYVKTIGVGFGRRIIIAKDGLFLYNINPYPEGVSLDMVTKYDLTGKKQTTFYESPKTGVVNGIPTVGGDLAADNQGNIFVIHASNFKIKKYSSDGKLIKEFGREPDFYSPLVGNTKGEEVSIDMLDAFTAAINLYVLRSNILLAFYVRGKPLTKWIEIYDVNGNYLKGNIELPENLSSIRAVSNDTLLFSLKHPNKIDENGNLPEEKLVTYTFNMN